MAAQLRGGETLRFRGTPGSLSAALRDPEATPRRLPVRLLLTPGAGRATGEPFVARAIRLEGDMVLQMTLPPRTPPGRYEGTAEAHGVKRAVVVEVEPDVELQIVPDQLTLHGCSPGARIPADVTVANAGNVPVEVRGAYAFGVFATGGLERALHRTYTQKRSAGDRRIDLLAEGLAEEHGGIVRVAIEKGEGSIEPGETRDVRLNFHLPSTLALGRAYTGMLAIHDVRYYVRLVLAEAKRSRALRPR